LNYYLNKIKEKNMNKSIKSTLVSSLCLAALLGAQATYAHDIPGSLGNGVLSGTGSGAVDVIQITCFNDPTAASQQPTDHLYVQLRDDTAGGGLMMATAIVNTNASGVQNSVAVSVTDNTGPADGVAGTSRNIKASPAAQDVTFTVIIGHTATATVDTYLLSAHCQDAAGLHTGQSDPSTFLQNY
jgi:hypothetical protein